MLNRADNKGFFTCQFEYFQGRFCDIGRYADNHAYAAVKRTVHFCGIYIALFLQPVKYVRLLTLRGQGDPDDWWRAAAAAAWEHLDATGDVAEVAGLTPPRT